MTALPLLMPHHGRHRREYEPGPLALFFRRCRGTVSSKLTRRRKPAAPEVDFSASGAGGSGAGAAGTTLLADLWPCCVHCQDGSPCEPRDQHREPCASGCDEPPGLMDARLAAVRAGRPFTAAQSAAYPGAVREHPYPWPPVPRPAFPPPTEEWRLDDTRYDLPVARPYAPLNSDEEMREQYFGGDWGTRPQAEVREDGRLAGVTLP